MAKKIKKYYYNLNKASQLTSLLVFYIKLTILIIVHPIFKIIYTKILF